MTTDLWMLLAAAGLHWALVMTAATAQILNNGFLWGFGNRDDTPEPTGWVARCERCAKNMLENLPIFAILVLVAAVSGQADELTAMGSITFVAGRVAHAIAYLVGLAFLRTGLWGVSIVGWGFLVAGILT